MEDQGEPRFPVVRGLRSTYNRTTVDGAIVASVDEGGRTVPMDIVPSVMAGRLSVIKTVTPGNDGNAIGGVIDIRCERWHMGANGAPCVRVLVTDNGQGMSPEVAARAAEPFFTTK